jgi:DNA-binding beta-propeller fold protein YncE
VSVPRISAFARLASGNVAPDRTIEGQATHLSRTMHGLAYDDIHDEIIVPVALSGAILVFKGGATGNEPPARIIQGMKTGLIRPHTAGVDPVNGEIYAGDPSGRAILVFDRLANGDVAPKREIRGEKTLFREIVGVAVDHTHDVLVVASRTSSGPSGLFMFPRTASGDVAPIRIISGNLSGVPGRFRQVNVDSDRGRIYVAVQGFRVQEPTPSKAADLYTNEASLKKLRDEEARRKAMADKPRTPRVLEIGFIGVWDINDNGNLPPRYIIRGLNTQSGGFGGVAFNPKHGEVYGVGNNSYMAYLVPQFFERPRTSTASAAERQDR